jgi:hypothetical protein
MKRTLLILALALAACGAKKSAAHDAKKGANADTAAKTENSAEPIWLVHDNGKRCIVAPCPSWTAVNVDTRASVDVATIDLKALKLAPKDEAENRQKVQAGQTWARGTIMMQEKAGPGGDAQVLVVTALIDATGKSVQAP